MTPLELKVCICFTCHTSTKNFPIVISSTVFSQQRALREKSGLAPLPLEEQSAANVYFFICILPLCFNFNFRCEILVALLHGCYVHLPYIGCVRQCDQIVFYAPGCGCYICFRCRLNLALFSSIVTTFSMTGKFIK